MADESLSELVPIFTKNNVVYDVQAYNFFWSRERARFDQKYILEDLPGKIGEYRVDYILWDTLAEPDWQMDKYSFLQKQYENRGLQIFKILAN